MRDVDILPPLTLRTGVATDSQDYSRDFGVLRCPDGAETVEAEDRMRLPGAIPLLLWEG
ncbi:MAG: hypothetical protein M0Z37_01935 [Nitrospiraceae bacterium]|nr:hypothetical protein [Nitrospiraceae bacterium]